MTLKIELSCTVAMLVILTIQIEGKCSNTPQDHSEECCANYYKEGDICKECPAGYYGDYCSKKCRYPVYGSLCSKVCTCSPCHHVIGCNSTQDTTGLTMIATKEGKKDMTHTQERTETYAEGGSLHHHNMSDISLKRHYVQD